MSVPWFCLPTRASVGLFAVHALERKRKERKESGIKAVLPFVLFLTCLPAFQFAANTTAKPVRSILILNEVGASYPMINLIDQGIRSAFENSNYQIEFYRESFDTTQFPDPADQQHFRDFYIRKYRNHQPDLIITVGPTPLSFMIESHEKNFSGVPIVYCLPARIPADLALHSEFTGVIGGETGFAQTVAAALQLKPETKRLMVVGGRAPYDRQQQAMVREQLKPYEQRLDISYLTELTAPHLQEQLSRLSNDTIVLMTAFGEDGAGTRFTSAESGPMITRAANVPTFSVSDRFLNHGEVGGYLSSALEEGRLTGDLALQVLLGKKPKDIPAVHSANAYTFDWRALQRWGMKEKLLPPGSVVLNRQPSVWDLYKGYILLATTILVLQTALIVGLPWQRKRRRSAEAEVAIAYDRLRLAVEAGKSVGWDWDIPAGHDRWFGDLQTIFGIAGSEFNGSVADFLRRVYPEDRELVTHAVAKARQSRTPYAAEFRVIRDDQNLRWLSARGKFYYGHNGDAVRMLGTAVDITERKIAEEALTSLSGRLIEAQDDERKRIAREIHDDYQQRLAMVAIELEETAETCDAKTGARLRELWSGISELGADLHSLSHSLHSSTLERLGLVAGIRSFCEEFSDLHEIAVDFVHNDVPREVSSSSALCLFRIVQEGLRNVKRHSGSDRAEVRLELIDDDLRLEIFDHGKGFDPNTAPPDGGIGIRSMEERLRLLGGKIEIHSRPMQGTTVRAFLPLRVEVPLAS